MPANMTDIFEALYTEYARFQEDGDAHTLTGGRFYRTQAPQGATFPLIVAAQVGGDILEMFSGRALEDISIQISVFDEFRNDVTRASQIMQRLVDVYNWAELQIPGTEDFIRMRREGLQQEIVEDRTHVHIFQDWLVEQVVPAGRQF